MSKVKRALIMAAGIGKRMQPVTLEIPKPLVEVNGKRMISSVIEGLHNNGITEIYIVVGYLKDKFNCLLKEYSNIKLIENPYYDCCNNISSLYVARDYIENSIILDGDQMIYNDSILFPEFEKSGYNCIWTSGNTKEWVLRVEEGIVKECYRNGGEKGWQLYSISRWNEDDGKKLRKHVEYEFEVKKNRQIYWDDLTLFCYSEEYKLGIHKMEAGDVIEIDNIEELINIDNKYICYLEGEDANV